MLFFVVCYRMETEISTMMTVSESTILQEIDVGVVSKLIFLRQLSHNTRGHCVVLGFCII
jgi:hypothetical protein